MSEFDNISIPNTAGLLVQEAFFKLITEDPTLRAILTEGKDDNLFRLSANFSLPGANFPYLVYRRSATSRSFNMAGSSCLAESTFDLVIYAEYLDAIKIADWLRIALDGYRGVVSDGNRQINIQHIHLTQESEGWVQLVEGQEDSLDVVSQTWEIGYLESPPNN